MKMFALVLCVLSSSAFADIKSEVSFLNKLSFDGKTLEVAYQVGGGCQEHSPAVELKFIKQEAPGAGYEAVVKVFDIVKGNTPDYCEALIGKSIKLDFKELAENAQAQAGINLYNFEVSFPKVEASLY